MQRPDSPHPVDRAAGAGLPGLCAVCRDWAATRICAGCLARFAQALPRCRRCAQRVPDGVAQCADCILEPPPFDLALAAVDYGFPWDGLVSAFKFHDAVDLAGPLAQMLERAVCSAGVTLPDWLLPVPLSAPRLRQRGYDQAWLLTRRLARAFGRPSSAHGLRRVRDTPHQTSLARPQRLANVRGCFQVDPALGQRLHGRSVALIDDVMTTGATLAEAARSLQAAGVASVQVWAFARTPPAEDR